MADAARQHILAALAEHRARAAPPPPHSQPPPQAPQAPLADTLTDAILAAALGHVPAGESGVRSQLGGRLESEGATRELAARLLQAQEHEAQWELLLCPELLRVQQLAHRGVLRQRLFADLLLFSRETRAKLSLFTLWNLHMASVLSLSSFLAAMRDESEELAFGTRLRVVGAALHQHSVASPGATAPASAPARVHSLEAQHAASIVEYLLRVSFPVELAGAGSSATSAAAAALPGFAPPPLTATTTAGAPLRQRALGVLLAAASASGEEMREGQGAALHWLVNVASLASPSGLGELFCARLLARHVSRGAGVAPTRLPVLQSGAVDFSMALPIVRKLPLARVVEVTSQILRRGDLEWQGATAVMAASISASGTARLAWHAAASELVLEFLAEMEQQLLRDCIRLALIASLLTGSAAAAGAAAAAAATAVAAAATETAAEDEREPRAVALSFAAERVESFASWFRGAFNSASKPIVSSSKAAKLVMAALLELASLDPPEVRRHFASSVLPACSWTRMARSALVSYQRLARAESPSASFVDAAGKDSAQSNSQRSDDGALQTPFSPRIGVFITTALPTALRSLAAALPATASVSVAVSSDASAGEVDPLAPLRKTLASFREPQGAPALASAVVDGFLDGAQQIDLAMLAKTRCRWPLAFLSAVRACEIDLRPHLAAALADALAASSQEKLLGREAIAGVLAALLLLDDEAAAAAANQALNDAFVGLALRSARDVATLLRVSEALLAAAQGLWGAPRLGRVPGVLLRRVRWALERVALVPSSARTGAEEEAVATARRLEDAIRASHAFRASFAVAGSVSLSEWLQLELSCSLGGAAHELVDYMRRALWERFLPAQPDCDPACLCAQLFAALLRESLGLDVRVDGQCVDARRALLVVVQELVGRAPPRFSFSVHASLPEAAAAPPAAASASSSSSSSSSSAPAAQPTSSGFVSGRSWLATAALEVLELARANGASSPRWGSFIGALLSCVNACGGAAVASLLCDSLACARLFNGALAFDVPLPTLAPTSVARELLLFLLSGASINPASTVELTQQVPLLLSIVAVHLPALSAGLGLTAPHSVHATELQRAYKLCPPLHAAWTIFHTGVAALRWYSAPQSAVVRTPPAHLLSLLVELASTSSDLVGWALLAFAAASAEEEAGCGSLFRASSKIASAPDAQLASEAVASALVSLASALAPRLRTGPSESPGDSPLMSFLLHASLLSLSLSEVASASRAASTVRRVFYERVAHGLLAAFPSLTPALVDRGSLRSDELPLLGNCEFSLARSVPLVTRVCGELVESDRGAFAQLARDAAATYGSNASRECAATLAVRVPVAAAYFFVLFKAGNLVDRAQTSLAPALDAALSQFCALAQGHTLYTRIVAARALAADAAPFWPALSSPADTPLVMHLLRQPLFMARARDCIRAVLTAACASLGNSGYRPGRQLLARLRLADEELLKELVVRVFADGDEAQRPLVLASQPQQAAAAMPQPLARASRQSPDKRQREDGSTHNSDGPDAAHSPHKSRRLSSSPAAAVGAALSSPSPSRKLKQRLLFKAT